MSHLTDRMEWRGISLKGRAAVTEMTPPARTSGGGSASSGPLINLAPPPEYVPGERNPAVRVAPGRGLMRYASNIKNMHAAGQVAAKLSHFLGRRG